MVTRAASGIERLDKAQRERLRHLGVKAGALDIFLPAMLKASAQSAWAALHGRPPVESMPVLIPAPRKGALPFYRLLGPQALRIDRAESLLREAHGRRVAARNRPFMLDPAPALRMGLSTKAYAHLLRLAGFRAIMPRLLGEAVAGPLPRWSGAGSRRARKQHQARNRSTAVAPLPPSTI
jgi:ATP-dependent RNA helicase SUPV3L1/SUV3